MFSLLNLHLAAVVCSLGVLVVADEQAFLWFIGKKQLLSLRLMTVLHYLMWLGLLTIIFLGVLLAYPALSYWLTQPKFLMKMCFVGVLITNAFIIGSLTHIASERSFASLTLAERWPLFLSGFVSTISWVGAATIGYFFLS